MRTELRRDPAKKAHRERWQKLQQKKRFIALAAVMILMAAGILLYIAIEGGTYTERMVFYHNSFITAEELSATVDREDIVEVEKVYLDSESIICIDMKAVKPGNAAVKVTLRKASDGASAEGFSKLDEIPILVTRFGTVMQTRTLNFDGYLFVEYAIVGGLALVCLVTLASFLSGWKKAHFSYAMVAYGGVALFCLSVIVVLVYGMQWSNTFRYFLMNALSTGMLFALVSAPLMLFISATISLSNIRLLTREGFRVQNMLGIVLGVVWIAMLIPVVIFMPGFRELDYSVMGTIGACIAYIASFMSCMLLSTIACAFLASRHTPPYDRDYLVILGCCIRPDGSLTPILKGRADAAIGFEKAQFAATGKHAKFVPSGGQGADEVISEAEAMARYLLEQGYPPEQIIREDKSVNTNQNIRFSRDKIEADVGALSGIKAGVATTNYHVFRSYVLAQKHGLDAQGISAKTKWYFFPNAFLREFVGLLWDQKIAIALSLTGIILFYIIGAYLLHLA